MVAWNRVDVERRPFSLLLVEMTMAFEFHWSGFEMPMVEEAAVVKIPFERLVVV